MRWMILGVGLAAILASTVPAYADDVTPSERVSSGVVIRAEATTESERLGLLQPGEALPLEGDAPRFWEVRLPDGRHAFVSKAWTVVIDTPDDEEPVAPVAQNYRIHAVDVATGLALFVEGPDFTLIYDGGSNDDLKRGAENRLLAYVRAVRPDLQTIDHVILSHPHRDHVELLPDLFAAYDVRNVWDSGRVNPICGYRAFLESVAAETGVIYHNALVDSAVHTAEFTQATCYGAARPATTVEIDAGSRITDEPVTLGTGAHMVFLHADGAPHPSPNENSLVVRLDLAETRVLLMGDAEAGGRADPSTTPNPESIEGILLECCRAQLAANVLVVGHHGSKTSSREAFLDAVGASNFIVSSGPQRYGTVTLPDTVVIDALSARGEVWRTDLNDARCRTSDAKIGPDNDNRAGGCDNVRIEVSGTGVAIDYWRAAD